MSPKPGKYDQKAHAKEALDALKRDLKTHTIRSLYVFHGEEHHLRDHYFRTLRTALIPTGAEAFNLKTLDGKSSTALDIIRACDCLPMMNDRTLVVVNEYPLFKAPEADRRALAEYLTDLPEYLCLVFFYDVTAFDAAPQKAAGRPEGEEDAREEGGSKYVKELREALRDHGLTVEFVRQGQDQLVDWITRHFKAAGHEIDRREAEFLLFYCGDLMVNLGAEIDKISAYAAKKQVTRADIQAVATPQLDAKTYELTDALSARDRDRALGVLAELFQMQQPPQLLLTSLAKYLRQLYSARVAVETGRTAADLATLWKLKDYPARKLMDAARRAGLPWCREALVRCARTDLAMKSTGGEDRALLTQLVLELVNG